MGMLAIQFFLIITLMFLDDVWCSFSRMLASIQKDEKIFLRNLCILSSILFRKSQQLGLYILRICF